MKPLFITLLFIFLLNSYAVDFDKAAKEIESELKEVNQKLDESRTKIFKERELLSRDISSAKAALENQKKSSSQLKLEIETLRSEISALEKDIKRNSNSAIDLLKTSIQTRRELETVIPATKANQFKSAFEKQDKALTENDFMNFIGSFAEVQKQLITEGGQISVKEIQAVSKNGDIKTASLVSIGNSHSFLLIDSVGGMAVSSQHHPYPELKAVPGISEGLKNLVSTGSGDLIFDFSNGLALKKEAREKTFAQMFKSGGVIMYPLAFLALICLIVGIWKTTQLYIIRSHYDDKVSKVLTFIQEGRISEAKEYIETLRDPVKKLLHEALTYKDTSRENLEELLNENILAQIPKLDRFMIVLSVSAGAAPLLGLLGTVMGIIKTFEMISLYGTGDPNTMAGGISEALVTTQAGLIVAIPALIWYAVLNRRLKTIVGNLEKAMLGYINGLSLGRTNI